MKRKEDLENKALLEKFQASKKVGQTFFVDEKNQLWYNKPMFVKEPTVYNHSDIINFELIEHNKVVIKSGLGTAIIGGATFGVAGAIIGSNISKKKQEVITDSLYLRIYLDSRHGNQLIIPCCCRAEANDIISVLENIVHQSNKERTQIIDEQNNADLLLSY